MKPEERAARRKIMWTARIMIGLVLLAFLVGAVKWMFWAES